MVILNGLKYACDTCIKGHRSSACTHTDRTLIEIKKKGRPITQCEHCRSLRKTRQVHVKCTCGDRPNNDKKDSRATKSIRLDPNDPEVAALITQPTSPAPPKPKPKHKAPRTKLCSCDSSGICECSIPVIGKRAQARASSSAASSGSGPPTPPPVASTSSCCSGKPRSDGNSSKPQLQSTDSVDKYTAILLDELARTTALPPLQPITSYNSTQAYAIPHPLSPAISPFAWHSGIGIATCSCGVACACPGCFEHADPASVMMSTESCPYACSTCTDCNGFGFSPSLPQANATATWHTSPIHSYNAYQIPHAHQHQHQHQHHPDATHPHVQSQPTPGFITTTTTLVPARVSANPPTQAQTTTPILTATITSACCGGNCTCSGTSSCICPAEDDAPQRIGFAVSGERGSCCSNSSPDTSTKAESRNGSNSSGSSVVPGPGLSSNSNSRRKRQKLDDCDTGDSDSIQLYPVPEYRPASASLQANPAQVHNMIPVAGFENELVSHIGIGNMGGPSLDGILPEHDHGHGQWIGEFQ